MIVVTLMGGLGNQMFQYAFGRGLAHRLGRRLVLDLSMLPSGAPPHQRVYGLGDLPISRTVTSLAAFRFRTSLDKPRPRVRAASDVLRRRLGRFVVREESTEQRLPDARIPHRIAICVGYWQSESYFCDIASTIRDELTPRIASGSAVARLLGSMGSSARILVHVRRGDYAIDPRTRDFHGLQPASYYSDAVTRILSATRDDAIALVLSDDPEWAQQNLRMPIEMRHVEFSHRLSAVEALGLMSRCEHHVISNSSFSWWGAWLAQHSEQRVVYPAKWIRDYDVNKFFRFPGQWASQ